MEGVCRQDMRLDPLSAGCQGALNEQGSLFPGQPSFAFHLLTILRARARQGSKQRNLSRSILRSLFDREEFVAPASCRRALNQQRSFNLQTPTLTATAGPVAFRSRPRPAWQQQQQSRDMTASTGVADVYQSLKAALDILKVAPPESVDVPSKQVLVRAAEQIKNDAAKSE